MNPARVNYSVIVSPCDNLGGCSAYARISRAAKSSCRLRTVCDGLEFADDHPRFAALGSVIDDDDLCGRWIKGSQAREASSQRIRAGARVQTRTDTLAGAPGGAQRCFSRAESGEDNSAMERRSGWWSRAGLSPMVGRGGGNRWKTDSFRLREQPRERHVAGGRSDE
jgi:hypothetical protein